MIKAEWTNKDSLDLQPTCSQLATDCISREAALKVVCDTCQFVSCPDDDKCDEYEAMKNLPSVEPPNDFLEFLYQVINPNRMETYLEMYHCVREVTDGWRN